MYFDMNMETGEYNIVRYEPRDRLLEQGTTTKKFVLIVATDKTPHMRWGARRYFLFDESRPRGAIYDATDLVLKVLYKPYVKFADFYR